MYIIFKYIYTYYGIHNKTFGHLGLFQKDHFTISEKNTIHDRLI